MARERTRAGEPPDAFEAAVRLLALRPHSAVELRRKLRQRGCSPDAIDAALSRARDLGYQDDAGFASSLVRARAGTRGRRAIAADLAARGVDRGAAAEALGALSSDDELAAARAVAGRMPSVDPRRLGARLRRRGFDHDVVRAVVRERAAAQGGDDAVDLDPD